MTTKPKQPSTDDQIAPGTGRVLARAIGEKLQQVLPPEDGRQDRIQRLLNELRRQETSAHRDR